LTFLAQSSCNCYEIENVEGVTVMMIKLT